MGKNKNMSYKEELNDFLKIYQYQYKKVGKVTFRYVLAGTLNQQTLIFLNGGMNVSEMWIRYVDKLAKEYQVLLFDYPRELKTNQKLVMGMNDFFNVLQINKPILIGASDGGMVAQIYTQKYSDNVGGLILLSSGGMDEKTIKSLKKKYFFAPIMLWYMKHCNYEKLKPRLIKVFENYAKDESEEDRIYAREMGEDIFKDYPQEKDIHISSLLVDLMHQTPVTADTFAGLKGHIMLILPDKDFFSKKMQKNLIALMHDPKIIYISGGHLSTVLKADEYISEIELFCSQLI